MQLALGPKIPNASCFAKRIVETVCLDCGVKKNRRADMVKADWDGRCNRCASKNRYSILTEEEKEKKARLAKEQVIRQGGIKNKKTFTKPGGLRPVHGQHNGRWAGGVNEKHQGIAYCEWRKKVYIRDGFRCQLCDKIGRELNAHHIKSFSRHPQLRYDVNNGVTLCATCHKSLHKKLR